MRTVGDGVGGGEGGEFIIIMHNLRKVTKKKKTQRPILNPEELAQQKLFEISRQDHEEPPDDSELFLKRLDQSPQRQSYPTYLTQATPPCMPDQQMQEEERKRPSRVVNYSTFLERSKSLQLRGRNNSKVKFIFLPTKQKTQTSRQPSLGVSRLGGAKKSLSCESVQRRPSETQRMQMRLKRGVSEAVVSAFQVKNIKLLSRYPPPFFYEENHYCRSRSWRN